MANLRGLPLQLAVYAVCIGSIRSIRSRQERGFMDMTEHTVPKHTYPLLLLLPVDSGGEEIRANKPHLGMLGGKSGL